MKRKSAYLAIVVAGVMPVSEVRAFQGTAIDAATQIKQVDFSGAPFTKPFKTGTALPPTCSVGEVFFKTDAVAGANVFGCTTTNGWTVQSGLLGASSLGLTDFATTLIPNRVTVAPGRVKFNGFPCTNFIAAATATLNSGTGGPGVAELYVSDSCALVLEYPNSMVLNFTMSGITAQGVANPSVPATAFWIAELTITGGQFTVIADKRSVISQTAILAGTGIVIDCTLGPCLTSIDPAVVPQIGGTNAYTGSQDARNAATTFPARLVSSDPPTCAIGEQYFNTTAKIRKDCTTLNTWSAAAIPPLAATSGTIGGSPLSAGACTAGTVAVANSVTSMAVIVTPANYPGDGVWWEGYVAAGGTVTVKVCAATSVTPVASAYNVRVIQ
jgi:hypothetical protein